MMKKLCSLLALCSVAPNLITTLLTYVIHTPWTKTLPGSPLQRNSRDISHFSGRRNNYSFRLFAFFVRKVLNVP